VVDSEIIAYLCECGSSEDLKFLVSHMLVTTLALTAAN
jgi:hypothetical protein